ncbi:TIGR04104 family putative zinc finger protein [Salipaludibacillus sp. HK11]|uniref:TIGR04104 family putative zinc finger protein n=1 Tax=Salipaludibacillus sp. HK11 TaxID=3394320 RepID=UPI0039FDB066
MKLSKCSRCNHQFKWKTIFNSLWSHNWNKTFINCSKCGTKHNLAPRSRFIPMLLLTTIFLFAIVINNLFVNDSFPFLLFFLIFINVYILITLVLPYLVNYEKINTNYLN